MRCGAAAVLDSEPFVAQQFRGSGRDGFRAQGQIDKACAGDRRADRTSPIGRDASKILLRDRARVFSQLFGQDEAGVGLIIAETRIGRRRDHRSAWASQPPSALRPASA